MLQPTALSNTTLRPGRLVCGALLAACLAFFASEAPARDVVAMQQALLRDASNAYLSGVPISETPDLTLPEAYEVQRYLVMTLGPQLGEVVGYKAGLTSPSVRKRFGVSDPVSGVLLENMFTSTGSTLALDTGVQLMAELDLLVRVRDGSINEASDRSQVLAGLSEIIPAVEVADRLYRSDVPLTGAAIAAVNVGARYFVLGTPIVIDTDPRWEERLVQFQAQIRGPDGDVMAEGAGTDLPEHPLDIVHWLRDQVERSNGSALKAGDLLSLGAVAPPVLLQQATVLRAVFDGLDPTGPSRIVVGVRR